MKKITTDDITVVILAGGQGQRMGGQDKGLVDFDGRPLIAHVIESMREQTPNIVINANRNLETYRQFGYPVIEDTLDDFQGPLAGMLAAMNSVDTSFILTLPCDGPRVSADYLPRMIDACNAHRQKQPECSIVVATDGEHVQPVYALIATRLHEDLQQFLRSDERKIMRWFRQHVVVEVKIGGSDMFANFNSPEQLAQAQEEGNG